MSANFTLTIPDLSPVCSNGLARIPYTVPGILALGPTRAEGDILYSCCHVLSTTIFSINDTACLQTAVCTVQECGLADPTFVCVAKMRKIWGIQGLFGCGAGMNRENAGVKGSVGFRWKAVFAALISMVAGLGV